MDKTIIKNRETRKKVEIDTISLYDVINKYELTGETCMDIAQDLSDCLQFLVDGDHSSLPIGSLVKSIRIFLDFYRVNI
jgi:hypothetical protein